MEISRMGRVVILGDMNDSLMIDDTVVEKPAQLKLQEWIIEYELSCSNHRMGWVWCG